MAEKMIPVEVPEYGNVPRWLVLQGEIDCRLYILENMRDSNAKRLPIERMIDESTGFDKQLLSEAKELIAELRWLKREFDQATEVGNDTELRANA